MRNRTFHTSINLLIVNDRHNGATDIRRNGASEKG